MRYEENTPGEGNCAECGKHFYGRKDKQFCSVLCKNKWHNRQGRQRRQHRLRTVAALNRNYEILDGLLKEKKTSAGLEELERAGYEAALVTGHRKGRFRHEEYSCFDIMFCRSDTKIFHLRRKESDGACGAGSFPACGRTREPPPIALRSGPSPDPSSRR